MDVFPDPDDFDGNDDEIYYFRELAGEFLEALYALDEYGKPVADSLHGDAWDLFVKFSEQSNREDQ